MYTFSKIVIICLRGKTIKSMYTSVSNRCHMTGTDNYPTTQHRGEMKHWNVWLGCFRNINPMEWCSKLTFNTNTAHTEEHRTSALLKNTSPNSCSHFMCIIRWGTRDLWYRTTSMHEKENFTWNVVEHITATYKCQACVKKPRAIPLYIEI